MSAPPAKLIPLRIRLPYASEEEFIERYGSNLARGGVFIATRAIKPEGTQVAFELVLESGARLMRGEGVILKTLVDEGGSRSGMTVRFVRLDPRSKALIDRVVAYRAGLAAPAPPEVPPLSSPAEPPPPPPEPPPPSALRQVAVGEDLVLGIDLGTTNSRAALMLDGVAQLIPSRHDRKGFSVPSVVAMNDKGQLLVGVAARSHLLVDPAHTVYGAKRLLGRRARSRRLVELAKHFPYQVAADPEGDAGVRLRDRVYRLPELAALLLEELKQAAQEEVGRPLSRAVLCVPAYFNDHQRAAMLEAGRLAGLDVLRILNEPSAVALAYGYGRGLARKRVMVYDLGGGTFDASVIELTGDDLEVVTTGGDNFLGGLDFDLRVASELSRQLADDERQRLQSSLVEAQRLRDAAESAKISLSDAEVASVRLPFATTRSDGSPRDLDVDLSRATLESLTQDLVQRTVEVTHAVLEAGGLKPQGLDEVILVGGQSRAPLVRRRIQEALGKPVRTDVDAHGAVAMGAAILGRSLLQRARGKPALNLSEVLSAPIGIAMKNGRLHRVLEKNTRLPAEKTFALPIRANEPLGVAVFQGHAALAEDNEYLGALHAVADRGGELSLHFAVSPDGRLSLTALGPGQRKIEAQMTTADASDEVRAALLAEAPLPGEPEPAAEPGLLQGIKKLFQRPSKG